MLRLPKSLEKLINELSKLPGVGPKTAQRLAFYLLKKDSIDINNLSAAIAQVQSGVTFCSICHNMAEADPCSVCADSQRDHTIVCVVEEPLDALALDKTDFKGVFHVLGGVLNPLEGIGPQDLNIDSLLGRVRGVDRALSPSLPGPRQSIKEIIIATNPSLEGETTAMHLSKLLKEFPELKVTRIARGLPMGGDMEYADDITLTRALEGRREY